MRNVALASLLLTAAEGGEGLVRHGGFGTGAAFFVHTPNQNSNYYSRRRRRRRQQPGNLVGGRHDIIATRFSKEDGDNDGPENASSGVTAKDDDDDDKDLPAWVKALTLWDASDRPSSSSSSGARNEGLSFDSFPFAVSGGGNDSNKRLKMWGDEMSPLVASLSGMVNVEALVEMAATANETTTDTDEVDVEALLPTIADLKRSILDNKASETSMRRRRDVDDKDAKDGSGREEEEEEEPSSAKVFSFLDNALRWEEFVTSLQKNVQELTELIPDDSAGGGLNVTFEDLVNMVPDEEENARPTLILPDASVASSASVETSGGDVPYQSPAPAAAEEILRDAAQRLDVLVDGTGRTFSPSAFKSLILRASDALAIRGAASTSYAAGLVEFANGVIANGYGPLFEGYPSAREVSPDEAGRKVVRAAEFASLSGAIYEEEGTEDACELGHSVVAEGKTADIGWMVTDSVQDEADFASSSSAEEDEEERKKPTLVRTIVIRGYDASDEGVDRERLLNVICTASPVALHETERDTVRVHGGMLSMARELLGELEKYIDLTSPSHKLVFTGHSIGGSLSILLMILLAKDRGASFVRDNILRVFTFGSPPIFEIESTSIANENGIDDDSCSILDAFDLPTDVVYGYCQPWDPITRLYSKYDPLYPLIDDLGEDGYTPWVSGPSRTLRPILKTILESWEGWPGYRDNARAKLGQNYRGVGEHFLLLPEPIRYLTDRLVAVNTAVPSIESVVQISSRDLLPALNEIFTLDTFRISYVSVAIRSFVHHFYPAYGAPVVDYAEQITKGEENA